MYSNVLRGLTLAISAAAIFFSGMAVGSSSRLFDSNPLAALLSKMTEPAVGTELVVPHEYNCSTCAGTEHLVRKAEDFNPVDSWGPSCKLNEGNTIWIKGKTWGLVVAEVIQAPGGATTADYCQINQVIVFDQDHWQWFLDDIAKTKEVAKVKEKLKPYTT
jgi:hypothetical protein